MKEVRINKGGPPPAWQMHLQTMDDPPVTPPGGFIPHNPMNDVILGPGVKIEVPTQIKFNPEQAKIIKDVLDGIIPVEDIKKVRGVRIIRSF
jgi:hypothetical protein